MPSGILAVVRRAFELPPPRPPAGHRRRVLSPDGTFHPLGGLDSSLVEGIFRGDVLRMLTERELISPEVVDNLLSWRHSGFSELVADLDPRMTLDLDTLDAQVSATLDGEQTLAVLALVFTVLAAVLAGIGLYAITSYSVVRRNHGIAVRMAAGAEPGRVLALMLGDIGRMLLGGAALGALASPAAGRLIQSLLYGIEPTSPSTMLLPAVFLLLVGLGSGFFPLRRATRVDPVQLSRGR